MGDTIIIEEDDKPRRPDVIVVAPEKKPKTERVTVEKTTVTETRHSDDE